MLGNPLKGGLLGMGGLDGLAPEPQGLLGQYYDQDAVRKATIKNMLMLGGLGLMGGGWEGAAKGATAAAISTPNQYRDMAQDAWQMDRAAQDDAWQNESRDRQRKQWGAMDTLVGGLNDPLAQAFPEQYAETQFQQKYGQPKEPSYETVTTEEGVFRVPNNDPTQMFKIGDRPNRNEGEGREFSQESKLRTEYFKEAKPFVDLRTNYQRITAAGQDSTGASDIAMVYSFMKMLDPTSVVREGEFATAETAGGIPSRVWSVYNRALNGERLAPEVRQEFMQQAGRQYQQQMQTYEQIKSQYGQLAQQYGVDPSRVAVDLSYGVNLPPDVGNAGGSEIPPDAVAELRADPSPQTIAEFNAVFGEGAAEAILRGQ